MTWLKDHITKYVLPGMGVRSAKPSSKVAWPEAGMIYNALRSKGGDKELEELCVWIPEGGPVGRASIHQLATSRTGLKKLGNHVGIPGPLVLHSFIKATVRKLKKENKKLVLPGRDAWSWAVLSAKMGVDFLYDPRVSRSIACHDVTMKQILKEWAIKDWEKVILFDTGFAGSVPRAIAKCAGATSFSMILASANDPLFQIFQGHTGCRAKVLASEYMSKYRTRAIVGGDGKIKQCQAGFEEFVKCALYTIWLWYCESPKRVRTWAKDSLNTFIPINTGNLTFTAASTGSTINIAPAITAAPGTIGPAIANWQQQFVTQQQTGRSEEVGVAFPGSKTGN